MKEDNRHSSLVTRHPTYQRIMSLLGILFLSLSLYAQLDAGRDDTINPGVPVTLTAQYGLIGNGITISDDGVEGPFPIGFSFNFFGNSYTQFYIGANGWISFSPNPNAQGTRQAFAVPSAADFNPKNCILGPFEDLNPSLTGSPYILYRTIGDTSAPKLLVMWCETPMYGCTNLNTTFQIVLNEGTNTIENHLYHKPVCLDWLDGKATLGLQNSTGYIGFAAPGKNATVWSADLQAWQFSPTSVDSFQVTPIAYDLQPLTSANKISWRWYEGSEIVSEEQECIVTPLETTTYIAWVQICNGQEFTDTVTVHVIPYIPNAFTPNGDGLNDEFRIVGIPHENITRFQMEIYNRWGERIFHTADILEGWDGTWNNGPCPSDTYIWVIGYEDGKKHKVTNHGSVILMR